jgi:hypothetical protein
MDSREKTDRPDHGEKRRPETTGTTAPETLRRDKDGGDEAPAGEDMSGEGSPGLTISGGGGHA